jgi:predicted deacylase
MAKTVIELPLVQQHLGTRRSLTVHRYGTPGARPKAYIQAGLHANEIPGMLVAHHLIARLDEADQAGAIRGEILVVPVANPIGLDQYVAGELVGRHSLDRGGNFNRGFADLSDIVAARIDGRLGNDPAANVALIRSELGSALSERRPDTALGSLRDSLQGLAADADMVLDLHCDSESVLHFYIAEDLWPEAADLAAQLDCQAVLYANDSSGEPFDEACSMIWWKLRARFENRYPIPSACLSATIELRGRLDVNDAVAAGDADNLLRFLRRRGVVEGDPGPLPSFSGTATPLAGSERLTAPCPGVIAFHHAAGDHVRAGDVIADIVDPSAIDPATARIPVICHTDGLLWARTMARIAAAGEIIASVAGMEIRTNNGATLLTP